MAKVNATYNRYLAGVFRRLLRWFNIELHPFLIVREDLQPLPADLVSLNPNYTFAQLTEAELPGIHALRPDMRLSRYEEFLRTGKECFGIFDHAGTGKEPGTSEPGKLIAKMWLNLESFNSAVYQRPLQADEAYLFDAFANPEYRGQNLAPYLRLRCYQRARQLGRTRIYSISDFTNTAARKFQVKARCTEPATHGLRQTLQPPLGGNYIVALSADRRTLMQLQIDRLHVADLSPADFFSRYYQTEQPVLVSGLTARPQWRASTTHLGHCPPQQRTASNRPYRGKPDTVACTASRAAAGYRGTRQKGYRAQGATIKIVDAARGSLHSPAL